MNPAVPCKRKEGPCLCPDCCGVSSAATTESLPALLREYADRTTGYIYDDEVAVLRAAADEIERLRATLKWISVNDERGWFGAKARDALVEARYG